jgi:hypothetical protein
MNGLYPIIRRARRSLWPEEPVKPLDGPKESGFPPGQAIPARQSTDRDFKEIDEAQNLSATPPEARKNEQQRRHSRGSGQ